jgi:tetratricopeptide (TPR) repeat protein
VFLTRDETLRRAVVVKVLPPDLVAGVNVERFRREILVAAGLQHPHIVPVLSSGETDGLPWFTMPFVEGESLRERLGRGPLPIPEILGVLREVAKALAYAHERGVVHRDIKPDNVLLTGGTAVVTDFGIAKALSASRTSEHPTQTRGELTQVGMSIGTPMYMAPEQAAGDPNTDARADIYSFGCMAYELLAGRPPFTGTPHRIIAAHMSERPQSIAELRRDAPPILVELVTRCLEKDQAQRPQTASDVIRIIDSVATPSGSGAAPSVLLGGRVRLPVAIATWAAVFVAAWILAKAAIVGIGLPGWVLPGALIVAALGLPVILFTAWVQRTAHRALARTPTLTPGGGEMPHSTLATMALRASPHVSWRRTTRGGFIAFGAFALLVTVFMGLRAFGIGPAGSLLGAGVISNSDQLVIADFSIAGADTVLARAVTEAIRTDLGQSNVMRVVPASTVNQTLVLMQKTPGSRVDTGVARVIATRTGAKAVLGGDVTPLGTSYVLTARLIAPSSGDPLAAFRETAVDQRDLVPAVERLSRSLRGKIGESLRRIHADPPLTQVTTTSLDALRLYAQGLHLGDDLGNVRGGIALLLQAVAKDSTFAMAWRKLGVWTNNAGDPRAEGFSKRAAANASHLPPAERFLTIASYHMTRGEGYDPRATVDAFHGAIDADSMNMTALTNIAIQLSAIGQRDSAIMFARRAAPFNGYATWHLMLFETEAGHIAASDSVSAVARARAPSFPYRGGMDLLRYYLLGRYDSATIASRRSGSFELRGRVKAHLEMAFGRLADARVTLSMLLDSTLAHGDTGSALDLVATQSMLESLVRNQPSAAVAVLEAGERRLPMATLPASARPYFQLAMAWSAAGRQDRAAQLVEEGERVYSAGLKRWNNEVFMIAKGMIALGRNQPRQAIAALEPPVYCGGTTPRVLVGTQTARCPQPFLAAAYDRAGDSDSALATYERFVNMRAMPRLYTDGLVIGQSLQRLGELYEAKGDRASAAKYYGRLIDLWKNADPELKPRVDDLRKRVARLGSVGG